MCFVFGLWRDGSIQVSDTISTASSQGWSRLISWTSGYRAGLELDSTVPVVIVSQPKHLPKKRGTEFPNQWLVTPARVIMLSQGPFILKVELVKKQDGGIR